MIMLAFVLFHFLATTPLFSRAEGTSHPVIIDTDIYSDVDDVGALAIANVLHNCGLCQVRGIAINTPSKYGALAASAINTYYNNTDIPISALQPFTNQIYVDDYSFLRSDYASKLATHFPRSLQNTTTIETPLEMYTRLLESAENSSVTIISLGFLTNLATLLNSSSSSSPSYGTSLVQSKVRKLVIMGGTYPGPGWEYNFGEFPLATKFVLDTLRFLSTNLSVTFSGFELGAGVFSGAELNRHYQLNKELEEEDEDEESNNSNNNSSSSNNNNNNSPIQAAYEWYVGRCSTTRESWDPITTLYGILGLEGLSSSSSSSSPLLLRDSLGGMIPTTPWFAYGNGHDGHDGGGYNSIVESNGTNLWVDDDDDDDDDSRQQKQQQRWLKLAEGMSNVSMAKILDRFYTHSPVGCDLF